MVFVQLACLGRCNGADVHMYLQSGVTEGTFRDMVQQASTTGQFHLIAAYSRKHLMQTGTSWTAVHLLSALLLDADFLVCWQC